MCWKEQERLKKDIRNVRNWNSELEKLVDMFSVHAVEEARKKQQAAEQKARIAEEQVKMVKKSVSNDVKKIRKQIEKEVKETEEKARFWKICFSIIVSG